MRHKILAGFGTALAAGLISFATTPVALADGDDGSPGVDTDFISHTDDFGLFTLTSAADPDDSEYVAVVLQSPLFTDILTSGADPSDSVGFGDAGIGVAGETVNTFIDPSDPALDSTFALPFTDPLAGLFTELIQLGLV